MNRLTIIGNLTRDPELRAVNTANGQVSVCDFTLAVNRRNRGNGQDEADFFRVTAWRGLGETCQKYLAKGRKVAVVGSVSCRTYTGSDGVTRATMEVNADDVEFLTPRQDSGQTGYSAPPPPAQSAPPPSQQQMDLNGFTPVEEELPF